MEEDATLRHFCCGDAGQPAAHYTVTAPPGARAAIVVSTCPDPDAMTGDYDSNPDDGRLRYWIAIGNGAACARSPVPMRHPQVSPTPVQLLGFLTVEAAHAAQQICLTASLPAVQTFLERLREPVRTGDVRVIEFLGSPSLRLGADGAAGPQWPAGGRRGAGADRHLPTKEATLKMAFAGPGQKTPEDTGERVADRGKSRHDTQPIRNRRVPPVECRAERTAIVRTMRVSPQPDESAGLPCRCRAGPPAPTSSVWVSPAWP